MKILLAGYNLDSSLIEESKKQSENPERFTPETISAAYARISRDSSEIPSLREKTLLEVEKARKSNEKIVFGLGHSSVAEHAVFNFDIMNVSRLAVESIQKLRLASFTEKSQRYIKLKDDFLLPKEISGTKFEQKFKETIAFQNQAYHKIYEAIKKNLANKYDEKEIDGKAKEDARYVVSLATFSQMGMTLNARTLENMLRQLFSSNFNELREFAQKLYETSHFLAPSLIKYTQPTDYDTQRIKELQIFFEKYQSKKSENRVELVDFTESVDEKIVATILFEFAGISFKTAFEQSKKMNLSEKKEIILKVLKYKQLWDKVSRHFEFGDFVFEINLSSSAFAQLKRHRISSQISLNYDGEDFVVPHTVKDAGMESLFKNVMKKTNQLFKELSLEFGEVASYILTNAHKKRVLFKLNLRELYHFSALREDKHAQWEIREIATIMRENVQKVAPITSMLLGGKDSFKN